MKVIFNSEIYFEKAIKGVSINAFMASTLDEKPKRLFVIDSIEVLRATNAINGNPLILLQIPNSEVRIIEFESLIEMFHFIDSISIFKLD